MDGRPVLEREALTLKEDQLNLFPPPPPQLKVARVIKRNGRIVDFDPDKITNAIFQAALAVGGSDRGLAEKLTRKVLHAMNALYPAGATPSVEEIQDLIEKVLIEDGHAKTAKAYILYRAEQARKREKKDSIIAVEDNIPYKLIWEAYAWNVDHECESVEKLNRQMRDGKWKGLVQASENRYHDEINKVADRIRRRRNDVRIVIVAGPTSSGKTTTTMKIGEALKRHGLTFILMSLDNYFKNLDQHPKDEFEDYDFESPHALEVGMINDHLSTLLKGKTIKMPHYDFKTGVRTDNVTEFRLNPGEIILIDSLHGLFDEMTAAIPRENKFKFYIEALCQIKDQHGEFVRWTDLRMLRRMIRDSMHRSYAPDQTVGHWHYVRRGEKKYIVPFIKSVDYVFNGSLPYELPVHKNFLEPYFPAILKKFEKEPKRADAYMRAQRVGKLLHSLHAFPDVNSIPKDSFLREFIGGGIYKY